jgi:hypothetical protein
MPFSEIFFGMLVHAVDGKFIPPFNIDILWAMRESVPDPTQRRRKGRRKSNKTWNVNGKEKRG